MFGSNTDVDAVLADGQKFIDKLNVAVEATQGKADEVQGKISKLEAERSELDLKCKKGTIVADRIANLITVTDEDLNGNGIPDSQE